MGTTTKMVSTLQKVRNFELASRTFNVCEYYFRIFENVTNNQWPTQIS